MPKPPVGKGTNLLTRGAFIKEMEDSQFMYVLVTKENRNDGSVLDAVRPLLNEFRGVFLEKLSNGLPLLRDIQH